MTAAFSRTSTHRSVEYQGERTVGGPLVYVDEQPLDKRLDVHREAPCGFDWGPKADDKRACQLAIALLVDMIDAETAVESYNLFAENVVRQELTGDSWTITSSDMSDTAHQNRSMDESILRTPLPHRTTCPTSIRSISQRPPLPRRLRWQPSTKRSSGIQEIDTTVSSVSKTSEQERPIQRPIRCGDRHSTSCVKIFPQPPGSP